MIRARLGVSRIALALALIVVIAVSGVVYYAVVPQKAATTSSASSSTSSSASSPTSSTSATTPGAPTIEIAPPSPLIAPGQTQNYTTVEIRAPFLGTLSGTMTLDFVAPNGISITLNQSSVDLADAPLGIPFTIVSSPHLSPGKYVATLETASATAGKANLTFTIQVVAYLVTMLDLAYHPLNLTVPVGANVTWLNLDGMIGCCDPGIHNVDFTSTLGVVSPDLSRFQYWSYVFSSEGTFYYYCSIHPFMIAEVVVVPAS